MGTKGKIVLWSIVGMIVLSVAGFFGVRSLIRKSKVAPFKEKIADYALNVAQPGPPGMPPQPPDPGAPTKIKGKIITVDMKEKEIDYIYFDLPEDIMAQTPNDVGTIVQLRWEKVRKEGAGYGTTQKPAFYQFCYLAVIDKESQKLIAQVQLRGGEPPASIKSSQSEGVGSKPEKEVVDFISRLPRS